MFYATTHRLLPADDSGSTGLCLSVECLPTTTLTFQNCIGIVHVYTLEDM